MFSSQLKHKLNQYVQIRKSFCNSKRTIKKKECEFLQVAIVVMALIAVVAAKPQFVAPLSYSSAYTYPAYSAYSAGYGYPYAAGYAAPYSAAYSTYPYASAYTALLR